MCFVYTLIHTCLIWSMRQQKLSHGNWGTPKSQNKCDRWEGHAPNTWKTCLVNKETTNMKTPYTTSASKRVGHPGVCKSTINFAFRFIPQTWTMADQKCNSRVRHVAPWASYLIWYPKAMATQRFWSPRELLFLILEDHPASGILTPGIRIESPGPRWLEPASWSRPTVDEQANMVESGTQNIEQCTIRTCLLSGYNRKYLFLNHYRSWPGAVWAVILESQICYMFKFTIKFTFKFMFTLQILVHNDCAAQVYACIIWLVQHHLPSIHGLLGDCTGHANTHGCIVGRRPIDSKHKQKRPC